MDAAGSSRPPAAPGTSASSRAAEVRALTWTRRMRPSSGPDAPGGARVEPCRVHSGDLARAGPDVRQPVVRQHLANVGEAVRGKDLHPMEQRVGFHPPVRVQQQRGLRPPYRVVAGQCLLHVVVVGELVRQDARVDDRLGGPVGAGGYSGWAASPSSTTRPSVQPGRGRGRSSVAQHTGCGRDSAVQVQERDAPALEVRQDGAGSTAQSQSAGGTPPGPPPSRVSTTQFSVHRPDASGATRGRPRPSHGSCSR